MQPPKPSARAPLRERQHVPRKRESVPGQILGVRPLYVAIAALASLALAWFLYGWWTYPVNP